MQVPPVMDWVQVAKFPPYTILLVHVPTPVAPASSGVPSHVAPQLAIASVVVLPVKPELQEHSYPVPGAATSAQDAPVPQSMLAQPSVSAAGARAVS